MEYQLNCEIKRCVICDKWIEQTNKLVIIKHKHYHKDCITYLLGRVSLCRSLPEPKNFPSPPCRLPFPH